jgi:hypothetical protein
VAGNGTCSNLAGHSHLPKLSRAACVDRAFLLDIDRWLASDSFAMRHSICRPLDAPISVVERE